MAKVPQRVVAELCLNPRSPDPCPTVFPPTTYDRCELRLCKSLARSSGLGSRSGSPQVLRPTCLQARGSAQLRVPSIRCAGKGFAPAVTEERGSNLTSTTHQLCDLDHILQRSDPQRE